MIFLFLILDLFPASLAGFVFMAFPAGSQGLLPSGCPKSYTSLPSSRGPAITMPTQTCMHSQFSDSGFFMLSCMKDTFVWSSYTDSLCQLQSSSSNLISADGLCMNVPSSQSNTVNVALVNCSSPFSLPSIIMDSAALAISSSSTCKESPLSSPGALLLFKTTASSVVCSATQNENAANCQSDGSVSLQTCDDTNSVINLEFPAAPACDTITWTPSQIPGLPSPTTQAYQTFCPKGLSSGLLAGIIIGAILAVGAGIFLAVKFGYCTCFRRSGPKDQVDSSTALLKQPVYLGTIVHD